MSERFAVSVGVGGIMAVASFFLYPLVKPTKQNTLLNSKNVEVIFVNVDWCGYCTQYKPKWSLIQKNPKFRNVTFTSHNGQHDGLLVRNGQRLKVQGYPTLFMVSGSVIQKVNDRDQLDKELSEFLKEQSA